jgi:hypothetical protein
MECAVGGGLSLRFLALFRLAGHAEVDDLAHCYSIFRKSGCRFSA